MTVTLCYNGVCVSGELGGGGPRYFDSGVCVRGVCMKLLHSIDIKAKSEKHIHNMTTIFCLYDCISLNDLP